MPQKFEFIDDAIVPTKGRFVDQTYDPPVWLGHKIRRRPKI